MSLGALPQAPIFRLSNEVLSMIFDRLYRVSWDFVAHGEKQDLLACRLACRRLGSVGQSGAFAHITFRHCIKGYEKLVEISKLSHLCPTVRHISCYFEKFEATPDREQFARAHGINQTDEKFDDLYEKHRLDCQSQEFLEDNNVDLASLAIALSCFPNLRTVRILEDLSNTFLDWFLHDPVFKKSRADQALFAALTSTLFVTGSGIERLVLGSFRGDSPALVGIVQGLDPVMQRLYRKAFNKVKCLEILLPMVVHHEDNGLAQTCELNYEGISALIQSAPLLEELRLVFDMPSQNALPSSFLDSLLIPKLRSLRLATVRFQDPLCLVRFCTRHATTLKRVEFSELCLQEGSWETVFTGLRDVLRIESVMLPGRFLEGGSLMEGFAERGSEGSLHRTHLEGESWRVVDNETIENFIQQRAEDNSLDLLRASEHGCSEQCTAAPILDWSGEDGVLELEVNTPAET